MNWSKVCHRRGRRVEVRLQEYIAALRARNRPGTVPSLRIGHGAAVVP